VQLLCDHDSICAAQQKLPRARQPSRQIAQRSPRLRMATAPNSRRRYRRGRLVAIALLLLLLPNARRAAAAAAAAAAAHAFQDVLKVIHPIHPTRPARHAATTAHAFRALLAVLAAPLEHRIAVPVGRLRANRWRATLLPRDQRGDTLGGRAPLAAGGAIAAGGANRCRARLCR